MPDRRRRFPAQDAKLGQTSLARRPPRPPFHLNGCTQTIFSAAYPEPDRPRIRLNRRSFQTLKKSFACAPAFVANSIDCASHKILDFIVHRNKYVAPGAGTSRQLHCTFSPGKASMMMKIEDIQQYGKEHFETVVASATTVQNGLQAIASAYGDYTKKSFEDTKSFVEKLSGVKSLDKALEVQTEFAKSSYETFVAESQKIAGLYTDLAKQSYKPVEGIVAKFTPAAAT